MPTHHGVSARGLFITFEGPEGSGKSTQLKLLGARLREAGRSVLETAEPGGTPIGLQIRRVLLDARNQELCPTAELLLMFAARAQNVDQWILPALSKGQVVLCDRFTDSTLVYQGVARGMGSELVYEVDRIACRGLAPDLTLVIDIDVETGLARARQRNDQSQDIETRMEDETLAFHRQVRDAYRRLAEDEPGRVRLIDGSRDPQDVAGDVWRQVEPVLART
ncbi:MAG: dTMP kinase [Bryobacterales bacterium]|nr:dTMP kinase [Bryobacterales bacterium]MBV9400972.1 dTMP kinase [Bryobacterales bacterium]